MTSTIAVIGKSGSGKTTIVKALYDVIKEYFPDKSILLVDNDLTAELAGRFGLKISTQSEESEPPDILGKSEESGRFGTIWLLEFP